jgi:hypothetical protein
LLKARDKAHSNERREEHDERCGCKKHFHLQQRDMAGGQIFIRCTVQAGWKLGSFGKGQFTGENEQIIRGLEEYHLLGYNVV